MQSKQLATPMSAVTSWMRQLTIEANHQRIEQLEHEYDRYNKKLSRNQLRLRKDDMSLHDSEASLLQRQLRSN